MPIKSKILEKFCTKEPIHGVKLLSNNKRSLINGLARTINISLPYGM